MEQTGIGGDDKVGIYIALQCLKDVDNIKVIFFRDEEIGCAGSEDNDIKFFNDVRFVLQCDRKGNTGFVTNASGVKLCSEDFKDAVKDIISNQGYSFVNGMMTDVMALRRSGIEVSMANIECGYYRPHSDSEYVVIKDVENCLRMVLTIIREVTESYACEDEPIVYNNRGYSHNNDHTVLFDECYSCLELTTVRYDDDYKVWCCDNCAFAHRRNILYK
jgi:putative aminopeptidase FrvX